MARPLRLELAGGLYHLTSRGNGREDNNNHSAKKQTVLNKLAAFFKRYFGLA